MSLPLCHCNHHCSWFHLLVPLVSGQCPTGFLWLLPPLQPQPACAKNAALWCHRHPTPCVRQCQPEIQSFFVELFLQGILVTLVHQKPFVVGLVKNSQHQVVNMVALLVDGDHLLSHWWPPHPLSECICCCFQPFSCCLGLGPTYCD